MARGALRKGDISWQFIGMMLFMLLLLLVLLWSVGLIGEKSFSLIDKIGEWFSW